MCQGHLSASTLKIVSLIYILSKAIFSSHRNTSTTLFVLVITELRNFLKKERFFPMIASYFRNTLHDTILSLNLDAKLCPSVARQYPSSFFKTKTSIIFLILNHLLTFAVTTEKT